MAKKVLIITGSARKDSNTKALATAFATGAMAAGNEVQVFDAASANLDGCHGDASCHERGYCGLKDDFVKVHELMCWADVLVLASPLYWKGFTSQIKRVIDRFYSYAAPKGRAAINVKETYLISAAGNPNRSAYAAMEAEFALLNDLLKFKNSGKLLANGVRAAGEAAKDNKLMGQAVEMGMKV